MAAGNDCVFDEMSAGCLLELTFLSEGWVDVGFKMEVTGGGGDFFVATELLSDCGLGPTFGIIVDCLDFSANISLLHAALSIEELMSRFALSKLGCDTHPPQPSTETQYIDASLDAVDGFSPKHVTSKLN